MPSTACNTTIADGQGVGTIVNDDTQPTISINNVSHNECNSGTTNYDLTACPTRRSSDLITVHYSTADNTATVADADYIAASGTFIFAPGETSHTVTVQIGSASYRERTEIFVVTVYTTANARIADGQRVGTIVNTSTRQDT